MTDDQIRLVADWLFAFADPLRLRIAFLLAGGEMHVKAVVAAVGEPLSNVSHHLRWMHRAGAVTTRKRGRFVYYSLAGATVADGELTLTAHGATFTLRLDAAAKGKKS